MEVVSQQLLSVTAGTSAEEHVMGGRMSAHHHKDLGGLTRLCAAKQLQTVMAAARLKSISEESTASIHYSRFFIACVAPS
jgi:hypothetical protein